MKRAKSSRRPGSVIDLFCGAGGLTHGFYLEGFKIAAGIDVDEACRHAYEANNEANFICKNVSKLRAEDLQTLFHSGGPRILVGCAPCQPFSSYNQKNDDPKWRLIEKFGTLVCEALPDIVSMENVPQLLRFQGGRIFDRFVRKLETAGYKVSHEIVFVPGYGVPQQRSRLVLLASLLGELHLERPTHDPAEFVTVAKAIGNLKQLKAGEIDPHDPLHRTSRLSEKNLRRIRASKPGGTWRDWDASLVAECHKVVSGDGYVSVYGRMRADEPSPTITTQFYGFGNGRFGHPTQDRALSLREGAILQSFPRDYEFIDPSEPFQFKRLGRLIGNAVPVALGQAIARSIRQHIREYH